MKNYMENKLKKGNFSFAFLLARRHPLCRPNLRSISSKPFHLPFSEFVRHSQFTLAGGNKNEKK